MRKMDEMELSISFKAIKYAFVYTNLFLVIWIIVDLIKTHTSGLPLLLLITQNTILMLAQVLIKWKLCKDEK